MSSQFDAMVAGMDDVLFDQFGQDEAVQRGVGVPAPVRVVIEKGVARYGSYGEVVGRKTAASFLAVQWQPKPGDVLTVDGASRKVEGIDADDGRVVKVVLHG